MKLYDHAQRLTLIALRLALALGLAACGKPGTDSASPDGATLVRGVESDDAEMNAAIQRAKDTLPEFIREFKNPAGRMFTVKTPLPTPSGDMEHIWVEVDSYANGTFRGKLGNDPENLPGRKLGDPIEVKEQDISDWMIADNSSGELKMKGGYTTEVLMKREKHQ